MPRLNTALEMHIEVQQGLQKVDSYQQDMFKSEEIDLHLNKQQERVVNELVGKEFQDVQLRLDYISSLIVKNHTISVLVPETTDVFYEPNMAYAVMPPNYVYIINDRCQVVQSVEFCNDLTTLITNGNVSEYTAVVPFPVPVITVAPFYTGFIIEKTENSVDTSIYTLPTGFNDYIVAVDAKFMIINNTLDELNRTLNPDTRVYWETYRGTYEANSYIFVRADSDWTAVTITIFNNDLTPLVDATTTSGFTETVYKDISLTSAATDQVITYADNGMTEGDKLYDLPKNIYYQSSPKEPTSAMADDFLYVYNKENFIITKVIIDYVRKPRQISLLLDQSCELSSSAVRADIVDRTIQYLKLLIENQVHREFLQDNLIKNQNSITNG